VLAAYLTARANDTHGLLVVRQALDAAGKDGAIEALLSGVTPGSSMCGASAAVAEEPTTTISGASPRSFPARRYRESSTARNYEMSLRPCPPEILDHQSCRERAKENVVWHAGTARSTTGSATFVENVPPRSCSSTLEGEQRIRFLRAATFPKPHWNSPRTCASGIHWDEYQIAFLLVALSYEHRLAPLWLSPSDRKWFAADRRRLRDRSRR